MPATGNNKSVGTSTLQFAPAHRFRVPFLRRSSERMCHGKRIEMSANTMGFTTIMIHLRETLEFCGSIEGAYNFTFINPTFKKGTTFPSSPWYFAVAENGYGALSNVHIRDAKFGAGVDPLITESRRRQAVPRKQSAFILIGLIHWKLQTRMVIQLLELR